MDKYPDIKRALEEVRSNKLSIRAASKKYQIPKSTLCDHICGKHPGKHGAQTEFNEEEEAIICANLTKVSEWGFPFTKFDLRILAKQYLDKSGRTEPRFKNNLPGEEWVEGFLRRNAELSLRTCRNIPVRRSKVDPQQCKQYFEQLRKTIDGVPPSNILNYDETNLGDDPGGKVCTFKRGTKYPEQILNSSKSSTSIMFAGTASGRTLPLYVVYKSEKMWDTWTLGGPRSARYNRSASGWFDEITFLDWFSTIVMPWANSLIGPKVVIGDNLSSHFCADVIRLCEENDIRFVCLPPNATHLLQPLDVAFFRPLKMAWREILTEWRATADRRLVTLPKYVFPSLLMRLCERVEPNAAANLMAGFRTCGIHPLSPENVLKKNPSGSGTSAINEGNSTVQLVSDSVMELLEKMRYGGQKSNAPPRKRKMNVEPGKSVTSADVLRKRPEGTDLGKSGAKKSKKYQRSVQICHFNDSTLEGESSNAAAIELREEKEISVPEGPEVGEWVLVKFPSKKSVIYYVACVEGVEDEELEIRCARKTGKHFKWPDTDDRCLVNLIQIEKKLDPPLEVKISRRVTYFHFNVDLDGYNIY